MTHPGLERLRPRAGCRESAAASKSLSSFFCASHSVFDSRASATKGSRAASSRELHAVLASAMVIVPSSGAHGRRRRGSSGLRAGDDKRVLRENSSWNRCCGGATRHLYAANLSFGWAVRQFGTFPWTDPSACSGNRSQRGVLRKKQATSGGNRALDRAIRRWECKVGVLDD
mgnify:CR=1 FL=1